MCADRPRVLIRRDRHACKAIRGWWTRGENLSATEGQGVANLPGGYRL